VPINASELNLTLSENGGNMTLLDENGKSVPFNSSYEFWQGDYTYSLNFKKHVKRKPDIQLNTATEPAVHTPN